MNDAAWVAAAAAGLPYAFMVMVGMWSEGLAFLQAAMIYGLPLLAVMGAISLLPAWALWIRLTAMLQKLRCKDPWASVLGAGMSAMTIAAVFLIWTNWSQPSAPHGGTLLIAALSVFGAAISSYFLSKTWPTDTANP